MARRIVLTVAPTIALPLLTAVHRGKIPEFEEAFLTSAGRGVVPIVEIDGQRLGTGMPGTITERLRAAYDAWAEAHLEPI
jgi:branched-subunit amino acid aminotransferase/4-amino-4-deoxychorismate lyase